MLPNRLPFVVAALLVAASTIPASLASAASPPGPEQVRAEIQQSLAMLHDALRGNREELFGTIVDVDRFQLVSRMLGQHIEPSAGHFPFQSLDVGMSRPEYFSQLVDADAVERWLESSSAVLELKNADRVDVHVGNDLMSQRVITLARRDWGWQVVSVATIRWYGC
jgi:hypothetical protein